ncbi:MAG: hypothetical protein V4690_01670 [Patescibacteria group bacterium]
MAVVDYFTSLLLGVIAAVGLCALFIWWSDNLDAKKLALAISKLKAAKLLFYYKTNNDVTAVCRGDSARQAEATHAKLLESGKINVWDKVVLNPIPTLTFAGSKEAYRPVHTGTKEDLDRILEDLIFEITGYKKSDTLVYPDLLKTIFVPDGRLYVPYSDGGKKDGMGKADFDLYGVTTLEDARRAIAI